MNKITTIGELAIIKHPDKIPVIVHYENSKSDNFLVHNDNTIGNFAVIIRQKIKLNYSEILLISVNGTILDANELISILYSKYKNPKDNCIHFDISRQNTQF